MNTLRIQASLWLLRAAVVLSCIAATTTSASAQERFRVTVQTDVPNLTLVRNHGVIGGGGNTVIMGTERLCLAPCSLELAGGPYRFFVENERGRRYSVRGTTFIGSSGVLHLGMRSRRGLRLGIGLSGVALVAIGSVVAARGFSDRSSCDEYDNCYANVRLWGPGIGMVGTGVIFASITFLLRDLGTTRFEPTGMATFP